MFEIVAKMFFVNLIAFTIYYYYLAMPSLKLGYKRSVVLKVWGGAIDIHLLVALIWWIIKF